jgi:protein-S-isoprenylcysteine O-methyltransferase Ste14
MGLAIRGVTCLGIKNTTGSSTGLVIKGPYRWTRNPQYLGFMLGLLGWGLMSGSTYTLIAGIAGWVPLYLVPRTEEPWLLEKYGSQYQEYLHCVPRYL